jgi:glycosyltransferase involved in cell wall biosynthesis
LKPVSVVYIITGLKTGGAEIMLTKLLANIDRTRFEPTVISLTDTGTLGSAIQSLGIPVHGLGFSFSFNLSSFLKLILLLKRIKPLLVHTWMYHADLVGGLAAKLTGVTSLTWSIRQTNLSPSYNKLSTLLIARICAAFSSFFPVRIVVNSKQAASSHVRFGYTNTKFHLIHNGFDSKQYYHIPGSHRTLCSELKLASATQLVGLIARYDPQKNHFGFLKAAKVVLNLMPDTHFVLAGSGVDRENLPLVQEIQKRGLEKNCHLLGPRTDMPQIMSGLTVLALPSHGEAFPNVVGEAMACETPCVVTDVGESSEIVGAWGRVVSPGDMKAFALNIVDLLRLPSRERNKIGCLARERVCSNYEIGKITNDYEKLYLQVISGN